MRKKGGIDLLDKAPNAVWLSDAGRLLFGGSIGDRRGFATFVQECVLEDNSTERSVLETHPRWTPNGWIRGEFYIPRIERGQHLLAKIGFIKPIGVHHSNGVKIRIFFNGITLYQNVKLYTKQLEEINLDLSRFDGETGTLILDVDTNGDSTQDWLVWIKPRVDFL